MTNNLEVEGLQGDNEPVETRPTPLEPVGANERFEVIDALRGFALLGILMVNIDSFAMSEAAMFNPTIDGGFSGAAFGTWVVNHLFFEQKMMSIFSMLFGAGIVLMAERIEARGRRPAGIHYRRMFWLLVIGLVHAYTLWFGDILVHYAIVGMLVYPLRRRSPKLLIPLGVVIMLVTVLIYMGLGFAIGWVRDNADKVEQGLAAGKEISSDEKELQEAWSEMRPLFEPTEQDLADERETILGSYTTFWPHLAETSLGGQVKFLAIYSLWCAGGLMLIGMALLKLGIVTGQRSQRFYGWTALLGLGLGLSLIAAGAVQQMAHKFDIVYYFTLGAHYNYVGSFFVALGYIGLLSYCWNAGIAAGLLNRLAAVGRMALTNYLMHSLLCAAAFFGWGLGWFGSLDRFEARGVVLGIWVLQLLVSPLWLKRYRFGPMEWLWRSLTYWKRQPL